MVLPGSDSGGDQEKRRLGGWCQPIPTLSIGPLYSLVAGLVQWACAQPSVSAHPLGPQMTCDWFIMRPHDIIKCNISGTIIIWHNIDIPGSRVISIINLEWATSLVLA